MIDVFNAHSTKLVGIEKSKIADLIDLNPKNIKWTTDLYSKISKGEIQNLDSEKVETCLYRPFTKVKFYNDSTWNWSRHLIPKYYPTYTLKNICIVTTGTGSSKDFSVMVSNVITEKQFLSNGQCFPLYIYEENSLKNKADDLFNNTKTTAVGSKYTRKDAIGDAVLKHFQNTYQAEKISKEDIFYYVYGLLHSDDYRTRYADNLTKELPRIPCVKKAEDFWAFSKAGRALAHWHLNYETVEPYKAKLDLGSKSFKQLEDKDFYVTKMKFPKKDQKDTVVYNNAITIREIPLDAYDYVVNGKSALEWVMERQGVSTHKDSGIVNDANDWAIETMGDAKYPLELFLRVITVSLETMKIVRSLPKLDI